VQVVGVAQSCWVDLHLLREEEVLDLNNLVTPICVVKELEEPD